MVENAAKYWTYWIYYKVLENVENWKIQQYTAEKKTQKHSDYTEMHMNEPVIQKFIRFCRADAALPLLIGKIVGSDVMKGLLGFLLKTCFTAPIFIHKLCRN